MAQTENAMQNIILEEPENLKGIFIATTNLAENMDAAFERRFLFKIKFENPSEEAKASMRQHCRNLGSSNIARSVLTNIVE